MIWFPEKFNRPEVYNKVIFGTDIKVFAGVSKGFQVKFIRNLRNFLFKYIADRLV